MSQMVLAFIMNINVIKILPMAFPEPINYCVGYEIHARYMLSCKMMDGDILDMWYEKAEA